MCFEQRGGNDGHNGCAIEFGAFGVRGVVAVKNLAFVLSFEKAEKGFFMFEEFGFL